MSPRAPYRERRRVWRRERLPGLTRSQDRATGAGGQRSVADTFMRSCVNVSPRRHGVAVVRMRSARTDWAERSDASLFAIFRDRRDRTPSRGGRSGVAQGLRTHLGMTRLSSRRVAHERSLLRLVERAETKSGGYVHLAAVPSRLAGPRRKRAVSPRLGLLRLAPRLAVVTGTRREPHWPVVASGIGAAMTGGVDPDDTPLCA